MIAEPKRWPEQHSRFIVTGGMATYGSLRASRRLILEPSHTSGSYLRSATRSFIGNDCVVGDLDVFGTHLCAALGDVAHTDARLVLGEPASVVGVEWVHVELGVAQEVPRAGKCWLVLLVVTYDVANGLAEPALDALAELLAALDVLLLHPVVAVLVPWDGCKRRDRLSLLVVERHIGDQVTDDRETCAVG